ncbi:MAG: hypothetical protein COA79_23010 [Planctomycetota bacterium]|nr:MAG: hypothetical protein COA79_23010 [Planctomycetota bacterium]
MFGGIIYFSTDSKPYDDKHLEIKIKKVPDKQNGYLKIMEAAKSMVWIDDLTSKQSVYIGGLSVEERHNKFFIVDKKDKDRQSIFIYSIF